MDLTDGQSVILLGWLPEMEREELPCPIRAGIAHYEFATIHPYYDGNGRTARLLTTLVWHLGGYDLKGLYSLEEYYARNVAGLFGISQRAARNLLTTWVGFRFLVVADPAKKSRKYGLAKDFREILD